MTRLLHSVVALMALVLTCGGAPLKVLSWNLESEASATAPLSIKDILPPVKEAAPDIILLQSVRDWDFCTELAEGLKPAEYRIALCTAFAGTNGSAKPAQLAILSLHKAYFSWSESWTNNLPGGFAFAALLVGDQRVGVFSMSMNPAASLEPKAAGELRGSAARQALAQFQLVRAWKANQPRVVIAGGTFWPGDLKSDPALSAFSTEGFRDSLGMFKGVDRATTQATGGVADALLVWPAEKMTPGRISRAGKALHYPILLEMPMEAASAAGAAVKSPPARKQPAPTNAPAKKLPSTNQISVERRTSAGAQTNSASTNTSARAPEFVPLLKPTGEVMISEELPVQPGPGKEGKSQQILWILLAAIGISFFGVCVLVLRNRAQRWAVTQPLLLKERTSPGLAYTIVSTESVTASDASSLRPLRIEQPTHSPTFSRALHAPSREPAGKEEELLRAGLAAHLSQWLKQRFVHRLLMDREQLLQSQTAATAKSVEAQEALSRIEARIRQQNAVYQARIEALSRELSAAREENRELIRARITEAKEEMAAVREKILSGSRRD